MYIFEIYLESLIYSCSIKWFSSRFIWNFNFLLYSKFYFKQILCLKFKIHLNVFEQFYLDNYLSLNYEEVGVKKLIELYAPPTFKKKKKL